MINKEMKVEQKGIHYAFIVAFALAMMMGFNRGGVQNAIALFYTPVSEALGVGVGKLSLFLSIESAVCILLLPIAGILMSKMNPKWLLAFGVCMYAGSFALFGTLDSVTGFYVLAVPMGFGSIFILQLGVPLLVNNWFYEKRGTALGLIMASAALFGIFLQPFASQIIVNQGWRMGYFVIGGLAILIVVPIILLCIKKCPADKGLLPYGATEEMKLQDNEQGIGCIQGEGVLAKDAMRAPTFYLLFGFMFILTFASTLAQYVVSYSLEVGYDLVFSGTTMSCLLVGTLTGSVMIGYFCDKIGPKKTSIITLGICIVAVSMMILVADKPLLFRMAVMMFGFFSAAIGVIAPILTTTIFGTREYSKIYANLSAGLIISSIVSIPVFGFAYDVLGSYRPMLFVVIAGCVVCMGLLVAAFNDAAKRYPLN